VTRPLSLLAIDDQPERYEDLARRLAPHRVDVLAVHTVCDVRWALAGNVTAGPIVGLFLDFDMPERTGLEWVPELPALPICVSSVNRQGARSIIEALRARGLPHVVMSALDAMPEERWLGWALDLVWRTRMEAP
jgi:hypothetical protein